MFTTVSVEPYTTINLRREINRSSNPSWNLFVILEIVPLQKTPSMSDQHHPPADRTLVVGLSGPSSSGKTTLAGLLRSIFNVPPSSETQERSIKLFIFHQDDTYKTDTEFVTSFYTLSLLSPSVPSVISCSYQSSPSPAGGEFTGFPM